MHRTYRIAGSVLALLMGLSLVRVAAAEDPKLADILKPVDMSNRGTIKGKVTLLPGPVKDFAPDNAALAAKMAAHIDAKECMAGKPEEKDQQAWRIGKNGGLANVVVYVRPQPGSYFKLTPADLKPFQAKGEKSEVVMDQPHCAYIPHVAVAFPNYSDETGKQIATGQVFKIKNSAKMAHNSKWGGAGKNPGANPNIPPGADVKLDLKADRFAIPVECGMHTWMKGYIIALDHPFYAVTDEDGNFEIKNVPAGMELQIFAWHENGWASKGFFKGETITVPAGKVLEKDFQAKGP